MKPIDIRNENFTAIRAGLDERRADVLRQLAVHGPCTTRDLATHSGIDLLTVRPRITELCQMGLVELLRRVGGEGVYGVRTQSDWETWRDRQLEESTTGQMQLV